MIMLSVWWDVEGSVCYELLKNNQIITTNFYFDLKADSKRKRVHIVTKYGAVFHHDNARFHTDRLTKDRLEDLG